MKRKKRLIWQRKGVANARSTRTMSRAGIVASMDTTRKSVEQSGGQ